MPDAFWHQTPRTIMAAVRGYRRRRAWLAWHTGVLGQVDQIPPLHELSGEPEPARNDEAEAERRLENLRAWKAALRARRV